MNQPTLILRADADAYTGTGHFMRCLGLAQAWKATGGHAVVATRCTQKTLIGLLQAEGIETHGIPSAHPDARDLSTTVSILDRYPHSTICIDGYTFDTRYQAALRS